MALLSNYFFMFLIFQDLPLSFGNLLNLKWLDLKGNPLESELEKFANECEDEKGYKRTAVRVVQLMQKRAIVQHEMVNNQNEFRKRIFSIIFNYYLSKLLLFELRVINNKKNSV